MGPEPKQIIAGDSVTWTRQISGYSALDGWALSYYLAKAGTPLTTVSSVPSGADYVITLAAATTVAFVAGVYRWTASVAKGLERKTIDAGSIEIMPNPASNYDPRTHADRCLAAIEAALEKRIGDPMLSYKIDGIEAVKIPHTELIRLRAFYAAKVRRQNGEGFFKVFRV